MPMECDKKNNSSANCEIFCTKLHFSSHQLSVSAVKVISRRQRRTNGSIAFRRRGTLQRVSAAFTTRHLARVKWLDGCLVLGGLDWGPSRQWCHQRRLDSTHTRTHTRTACEFPRITAVNDTQRPRGASISVFCSAARTDNLFHGVLSPRRVPKPRNIYSKSPLGYH